MNDKDTINLYYWKPNAYRLGIKSDEPLLNFGDELGPEIIEKLFGYKINWTPSPINADLLSVGSILQIVKNIDNKKIHVWGSGFISDEENKNLGELNFIAVRGKFTRDRLPKKYSNIPLGDPGLLSNLVYARSSKKTDKIGIIPHMYDRDLPIIKKLEADSRFIIISPVDRPENVINRTTECRLVLSSSLHGLIVADSFGIPNYHLKLSQKLEGGINDYKFNDYYSAFNGKYIKADIDKIFYEEYLSKIEKEYIKIRNLKTIQKQLIEAFPYQKLQNPLSMEQLELYRKDHEFRKMSELATTFSLERTIRLLASSVKRRIKRNKNRAGR